MSPIATTSQTVGPFFSIGCDRLICTELAPPSVAGERVTIQGRVLDADGIGVPDALLELWQANSHGKYAHPEDTQPVQLEPNFAGFGRVPTGANAEFRFSTIKPGRVPGPGGKLQAPHIAVSVFARGLLRRLVTRIYFPNDPANADDFALNLVPRDRRETLIAKPLPGKTATLEWNVVLQGQHETAFFDV
jgi:protocatechuate 3,4-dioxygenase, alpha subunit